VDASGTAEDFAADILGKYRGVGLNKFLDVEWSVAAVAFDHALLRAVHAVARRQRRTLHSIRTSCGLVACSRSTDRH